jgi:acyl-CoA synthetase (AMP-forming)/AMP-acid ligase II
VRGNTRTNAIAHGLRAGGIGEGDGVAVLCHNHRGFIEATVASSKLGANAICMNTGFAGPQIAEVCKREGLTTLVYDEEFSDTVSEAAASMNCFVAWHDSVPLAHPAPEELVGRYSGESLRPPSVSGRVVILTSGTTGLPKGAAREHPDTIATFAPFFSKIPLRTRRTTVIAALLFHTWGFAHFGWGLILGSTIVLQRRFDPEQTLAAVERHRAHTLVVVPVMLQRILDLPPQTIRRYDTRSQRVIAASGSALPGELALRAMDAFGDVLYNRYGSAEVAWATTASPAELRAAPGTAGTPPRGTIVRIYDDDGNELTQGETGRIFVGNELMFDGSDRVVRLAGEEVESLRLGYAAHVYRQQGATVDRSVVLTGGWQASKETAYVEASRARQGTDWFVSREDLGVEGHDTDRISRLAGRMTQSRARTPSVIHREIPGPSWDPSRDPLRLSRLIPHVGQLIRTPARDAPDRDVGRGR